MVYEMMIPFLSSKSGACQLNTALRGVKMLPENVTGALAGTKHSECICICLQLFYIYNN